MKKYLCVFLLFLTTTLSAQEIKIGVLAPEGTTWAENMKKMAEEIAAATENKVRLRIYFGGTQGDEHDVLRKIRVGQLQGGIFTGKTLGDINGDVRVIEVPFNFNGDRKKAMAAVSHMQNFFNEGFKEKGFENLGFFEIGDVYFVSQKKAASLNALKGIKIWSWEGDRLVTSMIQAMGLVSVPLPITDVLSSLSSGIIEAAYAPPLGIIALQWNTRVNYILDLPISFSIGAFLVNSRTWERIPAQYHQKIREISAKYVGLVNEGNAKDNDEAKQILAATGLEFITFPKEDIATSKTLRDEMIKRLKGPLFSEKAFEMFDNFMKK